MENKLNEEFFVPYNLALKLKNIGYDGFAFANYTANDRSKPVEFQFGITRDTNEKYLAAKAERLCLAPMWNQVAEYLECKHGIYCTIIKKPVTIVDEEDSTDTIEFGFQIIARKGYIIIYSEQNYEYEFDAQVAMLEEILKPEQHLLKK